MTITDSKGETHDVTGSGQGLYNTIAGSIGALGALGNGSGNGLLGGLFGGNNSNGSCSENQYVTRYDASLMQQMANKDMEISILKSANDTDKKLVDVYATLKQSDNAMRDRIDAVSASFAEKLTAERESRLVSEKEQAVFNQSMIGSTSTINQQINQLNTIVGEITANVVPQNKVCNTCCCNCGD